MNPSSITSNGYSAWPHRLAVALCCAVFPLIWLGGLVTTYDAGMAVPDWPSTYGYNLFLYPWQTWLWGPFDLFIEHGHRLLGAVVGLLSIGFVVAVFRVDSRRAMRTAAVVMFLMVLAQGVLGGMRVRLDERTLALAHACFGLATFGYAAAMAVVTSRYWREASDAVPDASPGQGSGRRTNPPKVHPEGAKIFRLAVLVAILVYVQVIVGALLRHVPVAATPGFFRVAVVFHIVLALAVLAHVILLAVRGWKLYGSVPRVGNAVGILGLLTLAQVALGGATWVLKYGWPSWFAQVPMAARYTVQANSLPQAMVTTLHVAIGALILAVSVVVALRSWRFFRLQALAMVPGSLGEVHLRSLTGRVRWAR